MQTIRDYRLGKRFPTKEDFSDDTEILWRKGSISIVKLCSAKDQSSSGW